MTRIVETLKSILAQWMELSKLDWKTQGLTWAIFPIWSNCYYKQLFFHDTCHNIFWRLQNEYEILNISIIIYSS